MSKKNKKKLFLNDRIEHNIIGNLYNLDTNIDKNLTKNNKEFPTYNFYEI